MDSDSRSCFSRPAQLFCCKDLPGTSYWLFCFAIAFPRSPDCWKCSCWKCSFLTSWWWSSRQETEHCDVHQSVQSTGIGTCLNDIFQGKQEEQQSTTHQQQQPEPSHFYQEKILQKCVHSSGGFDLKIL